MFPPDVLLQQCTNLLTTPLNPAAAQATITSIYAFLKEPPPRLVIVDNPIVLCLVGHALRVYGGKGSMPNDVKGLICHAKEFTERVLKPFVSSQDTGFALDTCTDIDTSEAFFKAANRTIRKELLTHVRAEAREVLVNGINLLDYRPEVIKVLKALDCPDWVIEKPYCITDLDMTMLEEPDYWIPYTTIFNLCMKNTAEQTLMHSFVQDCGWCILLDGICIMSERALSYTVNSKGQIHNDGKPAISFKGFDIYGFNGNVIPAYIGSTPTTKWKGEWVLTADRADMRALLVSGMGPQRFVSEIGGVMVSSFSNTLTHSIEGEKEQTVELYEPDFSRFNPHNKFKVLHLRCPSTELDHWHWVPHDITSAREAYTWFWHGRPPETMKIEA